MLVTLRSLRLVQALERAWEDEKMTVAEGLERLSQLCVMEMMMNGKMADWTIPEPRADVKRMPEKAGGEAAAAAGAGRAACAHKDAAASEVCK